MPCLAHRLAKGAGKTRLVIDREKGADLDAFIAMLEIHGRGALVLVPVEQQPHLLGVKPAHLPLLPPARSDHFNLVGPDGNLLRAPRAPRLPHRKGRKRTPGNDKTQNARQQKFRHGDHEGQAKNSGGCQANPAASSAQ